MKKTNKILTNVLLGALTLSSLGLANVQAQEGEEIGPKKTEASIEITDGKIEHSLPSNEIVFPLKKFSFADFFGNKSYKEQAISGSLALGVNDQRSLNGLESGWKVTAELSKFKSDVTDGETLPDTTYISLESVSPQPTNQYVKDADPEVLEEATPKVNGEIKLYAKGSDSITTIWYANRGVSGLEAVGVDKWTLEFFPKDISLTIPHDKLVGGSHSAEITWTFSNTYDNAPED